MRKIVELALTDAAHGDYFTLVGLLDFLISDRNVGINRIIGIADRQFKIPPHITVKALHEILTPPTFHYC